MNRISTPLVATLILAAAFSTHGIAVKATTSELPPGHVLLTGQVRSAQGNPLEGVTLSLRMDKQPVTTSVFSDAQGNYYFPPVLNGKYHVWAQAPGFKVTDEGLDLSGKILKKNLALETTTDLFLQLSGDQQIATFPQDTAAHRRMKDVFMRNCVSCHSASVALQYRFDKQGWTSMINAMGAIRAIGGFSGEGHKPPPALTYFGKDLADYLAEVRGPVRTDSSLKPPQRPTGESTLPVVYTYDIPFESGGGYVANNGIVWSDGPSIASGGGQGDHDAQVDWNGNLWLTYNNAASLTRTISKIDGETGEVHNFAVPAAHGHAATSHGMTIAHDGVIWFTLKLDGAITAGAVADEGNSETSGLLGRIDPVTEKLEVFTPPNGMAGPSISVDEDGLGNIWASTGRGAVRFNPKTKEFTEFKSPTHSAGSYGVAGDREGNGWWTQISIDILAHSDVATNKASEFLVPPEHNGFLKPGDLSPDDIKAYGFRGPEAQAPRRIGSDKTNDDIWVPNYSGNNLMRINRQTMKTAFYPLPQAGMNPYMAEIDGAHSVWINLQGSDDLARFDPSSEKWTFFNWPIRGTSTRDLSILDHNGKLQLVTVFFNAGSVGRMVIRTPQEMDTLKARVASLSHSR